MNISETAQRIFDSFKHDGEHAEINRELRKPQRYSMIIDYVSPDTFRARLRDVCPTAQYFSHTTMTIDITYLYVWFDIPEDAQP